MAQATYSIRLDQDKKAQFDEICGELGLSSSAAISTFVNKTVEQRGIPYELKLAPAPEEYGVTNIDNLTTEELKQEIRKGLDSIEHGRVYSLEEVAEELLEKRL